MMKSPVSHAKFGIAAAFLVGLAAICWVCRGNHRIATHQDDDGWRRTAQGWEQARDWQAVYRNRAAAATAPGIASATRGTRWDTHPAALSLGQIIVRGDVTSPATAPASARLPSYDTFVSSLGIFAFQERKNDNEQSR